MRRFNSYGPVDCERHFCVARRTLVQDCLQHLVDSPEKGGHYFTIWGPRQTGKTWLIRQMMQEIPARYGERFAVCRLSFEEFRGLDGVPPAPDPLALPPVLRYVLEDGLPGRPSVETWPEFSRLFSKDGGLWDRPLLLLIDEVDTAPPEVLDMIVGRFRKLYLERENNWLHGLALAGVRAVLGIESQRGSPFNIQRSLQVPNLSFAEVEELYQQYQRESGQSIDPEVVAQIYPVTRGQPGLVSWFGELLTEKYNPGADTPLDMQLWENVYHNACYAEFNNTVLNIVKKARTEYRHHVLKLFARPDIQFSLDADWCNYMYLHGLIDKEKVESENDTWTMVCCFASPFIQLRVYNALTYDLVSTQLPILALDPLDDLADVFAGPNLNLPALLKRYKDYLTRLQAQNINPWKKQPRRKTDLQLAEAVGHFHLYAWLRAAVDTMCVVSPEFPTGNGKVDLHLRCDERRGIIEVKSFRNQVVLHRDCQRAARYAQELGLDRLTLAVFIPVTDKAVLEQIAGTTVIDGVQVTVAPISWV